MPGRTYQPDCHIMPAAPSRLLLVAAFGALYFIWGSTYLAIRFGVESWPPLLMAGIRFVIAGGLMFGWLRWRGTPLPSRSEWAGAARIGFLLLVCGNGCVTIAEQWVASGVAALGVATVPLFTLLFARMWGQHNTRLEWAGILLGFAGMVLLNLGHNMQASPLGAGLILFAAAAWALGSVWARYLQLPPGAMAPAAEMLCAGVMLLLLSVLTGEQLETPPTLQGWLALLYLVVFGSLIAFSAYQFLLRHVRPAAATSYAYVNPVVAVLLGMLFADEMIGQAEWLAMGVIVAAVVLIGLPRRRRG